MADYQAQIRLGIQGLNQLRELENRLENATSLMRALDRQTERLTQAQGSAERNFGRAIDARSRLGTAGSRGMRTEAQRAADREIVAQSRNLREVNTELRRYRARLQRANRIIGDVALGVGEGQRNFQQIQGRIARESRINYLQNLFQSRSARFQREGGGANLNADQQRQAQNIRAAFALANQEGRENLQLMQRLATEMSGLDQRQREFNLGGAGRSKAFEAARRAQERLDELAERPGVDQRRLGRLRAMPRDVIEAANRGDVTGAQDAQRRMTAAIGRYTRELDAAARDLRIQQMRGGPASPLRGTVNMPGSPMALERSRRLGGAAEPVRGRADLVGSPAYYEAVQRELTRSARLGGAADPIRGRADLIGSPAYYEAQRQAITQAARRGGASEPLKGRPDLPGSPAFLARSAQLGGAADPIGGRPNLVGSPAYYKAVQQELSRAARLGGATSPVMGRPDQIGSPAYYKAVQQELDRAARIGGARSPVQGATNLPGSPAFLAAQQAEQDRIARQRQIASPIRGTATMPGSPAFLQAQERAAKGQARAAEQAAKAQLQNVTQNERSITGFAKQQATIESFADRISKLSQAGVDTSAVDQRLNRARIQAGEGGVRAQEAFKRTILELNTELRRLTATAKTANRQGPASGKVQRLGPASPIMGTPTMEGSPRFIAAQQRRQQQGGLFRGNAREAISSGLIGGGFPLLFGQGLGGAVGGGIGGVAGGFLGGGFGFGVSVIGTAIGAAVDQLTENLKNLAGSLKSPTEALAALEQGGFRVTDSLKFQVEQLNAAGRAYDAQTLVLQEVERRLGAGSVRELNALSSEQKRLEEQWARMTGELQGELLPALIATTEVITSLASGLKLIKIPEALLRALGPTSVTTEIASKAIFRGAQNRGRSIAAGAAGNRQPLTPQEAFAAEGTRINRGREAEDLQRSIQRGELDLVRRKQDIEFAIIDQRRAESDYEKSIADFRWSVEQRILKARSEAIRAEQQVASARSDVRVAEIGIDFDEQIFEARTQGQKQILEASKSFLQAEEQTRNQIEQNKIETELRIEDLKRSQVDRERQLEREKEALERRKDELLRGRIQLERNIADYQMQVADYQRETARKILDAWRQVWTEMQAASSISGGMQFSGGTATEQLLAAIRSGEGTYTSVNRGRAGDTPGGRPNLTSMTLDQVMAEQQAGKLFAVGAYQFIPQTLRGAVQRSGLPGSTQFTPGIQDQLAKELIFGGTKRPELSAYLTGRSDNLNAAQNAAAAEWAALVGTSGRGRYDGDSAGNRGSINVRDLLPRVRQEYMGGGMNSAVAGAFQGPNARPEIPINQPAILNGQAVIWNGRTWEPAAVPGAGAAGPQAAVPVNLQAPARPVPGAALSAVSDTSALERAERDSTSRQIEAAEELNRLLDRRKELEKQSAFNILRRAIEGENRVAEAAEELSLQNELLKVNETLTDKDAERVELAARQRLEYRKLGEEIKIANQEILRVQGLEDAGRVAPGSAATLRKAASDRIENVFTAQGIDRQTLETQQIDKFQKALRDLNRQIEVTGAGLRSGLIGPAADAFEQAQLAGFSPEQTQQLVERAKLLQDQQLIWNNLAKDITNVSDAIAGGLTQGLADIVTGARSIKEVGKEVLDSVARTFLDSAQQQLSVVLQRSLAGALGGEGGLLNGVFGTGSGLSGASGPSALGAAASAAAPPVATMGTAALGAGAALQQLAASASIAGSLGGGLPFSGGGPNILGSLLGGASPITSAFSGGGIGPAFSAAAPNLLGGLLGGISPLPLSFGGFFADGGTTKPNEAYVVGEEGPELFIPGVSGKVLPNRRTAQEKAAALQDADNDQGGTIDVRYESKEIAGEKYVTETQFRKGMQRAAKQGQSMAYSGMRNNGAVRQQVGI